MTKQTLKEIVKQYDAEKDIAGRAGGNYGHYLADRILEQREIESHFEEIEYENDIKFINEIKRLNISPDNIFIERDIKEKLIRDYKGYKRLNTFGQKYKNKEKGDFLSQCSDSKICKSFKNIYYSTIKKIKL